MIINFKDDEITRDKFKNKINFDLVKDLIETINANEHFFKEMYNLHKFGEGYVGELHLKEFGKSNDPLLSTVLDMYFGMKLEEGIGIEKAIKMQSKDGEEIVRFTDYLRQKGIENILIER